MGVVRGSRSATSSTSASSILCGPSAALSTLMLGDFTLPAPLTSLLTAGGAVGVQDTGGV